MVTADLGRLAALWTAIHRLDQLLRIHKRKRRVAGRKRVCFSENATQIKWDELVVSWNADLPKGVVLKIETRAIYPAHSTRFYTMGIWSGTAEDRRRMSVKDQKDNDAEVLTDTLALKAPCDRVRIRLILSGAGNVPTPPLKFLGLSFADKKYEAPVLPPNRTA